MTQGEVLRQAAEFMVANSTYTNAGHMEFVLSEHVKHGTCVICVDKGEVIGVLRWNQMADRETAHICDFIVAEKARRSGVPAEMLELGKKCAPWAKYVKFERGYDSGTTRKEFRTYRTDEFLRRVKHACSDLQHN